MGVRAPAAVSGALPALHSVRSVLGATPCQGAASNVQVHDAVPCGLRGPGGGRTPHVNVRSPNHSVATAFSPDLTLEHKFSPACAVCEGL